VSYTYQWRRCDASGGSCVDIAGETGASYTLAAGDLGKTIRVVVSDGTHTVTSDPTAVVGAVSPSSAIYWGARISGTTAYNHFYGGERTWGDAPWDLFSWDRFEHGGKTMSIVHYGQPGPWGPWNQTALDTTALNHAVARGAVPLIDLGKNTDDFAGIIAGSYDAAITTWATNIKNWGKPLFLRPWWEMNGSWFGWGSGGSGGLSASQYKAMFQRFWSVCDAAGADNISWVWCPNYILTSGAPVTLLDSLYPGDGYVDWVGFDAYNVVPHYGSWVDFTTMCQLTYDTLQALAPSKPIIICEFGCGETGGSKASWFTDALTSALPSTFPAVKAVVYYEAWTSSLPDSEVPIETTLAAQNAWVNGLSGSSYFAPKFASYPSSGKVPVPA
jgi:hypothetical protein